MIYSYYFIRPKKIPAKYWNLVYMHELTLKEAIKISIQINSRHNRLYRRHFIAELFKTS
jgi:hypothetical protein